MLERKNNEERIQPMNFRSKIICYRPGGNDTALIINKNVGLKIKKSINDYVMKIYPNIEQVGFVAVNEDEVRLNMAGGEFCGNATRSVADLTLNGQPGNLKIKVSGVENVLKAGILPNSEAYAQMPVYEDLSKIYKDSVSESGWIVEMEGITHYVEFDPTKITDLNDDEIKKLSFSTIREKGLLQYPASGVIYVKSLGSTGFQITPVVYVKEIDTLFLETACGSGTCAVGEILSKITKSSINELPILQPSGQIIKISVENIKSGFRYAQIQGQIKKLSEGVIRTDSKNAFYIVEQLDRKMFEDSSVKKVLIKLYKDIFGEKPYFELFTDEEVTGYFEEYIEKGKVLIARNDQGVVGFSATLPLNFKSDISNLASQYGIDTDNCQYIAELGVRKDQRRKEIGQGLIEELLLVLPENVEILLRTTKTNEFAISLYEKLGFKQIPEMKETVKQNRIEDMPLEDQRIFLIKSL